MSVVASLCPLNNVFKRVWIQNAHSNKPYVYTKSFLTLLQLLTIFDIFFLGAVSSNMNSFVEYLFRYNMDM